MSGLKHNDQMEIKKLNPVRGPLLALLLMPEQIADYMRTTRAILSGY